MKRKADTLVEIIIAMLVFGIIMSGTFDFMSNQTMALVRMRERDDIMYQVQRYINYGTEYTEADNVKIESQDNIITASKGSTTMTFRLR